MTHDDFLSHLEGLKRQGSGHVARCPAHEDRKQSLGVHQGDDGRTLVRCYASCTTEQIVAALGLELKDLFEDDDRAPNQPEAIYDYVDENGELVQQVLRLPGKSFRQRRPDGAGDWVWKMEGVERVPYRLPEVLEAISAGRWVIVVEGEKDADALVAAGATATCNPGGAGKWQDAWAARYFTGANVMIVVDLDEAGKAHAQAVMASLEPYAARVKAVRSLAGKDAYDHLRAGHGLKEFAPFNLNEITDGLVLQSADELLSADVDWLPGFEGFIPYSGISMVFGNPGSNKSTLTCLLAGIVTRNGDGAIFMSGEDTPEMKPRLFATGADLSKCLFLSKRTAGADSSVTLPHDIAALETLIEKHSVRLVVIDPIDNVLGIDVDSYKAQSVRYALNPLVGVAQRHKCAIVLVSHLTQEKTVNPMRRAGGSRLTGIARACSVMVPDRYDEGWTRILASFKNSWGPIPRSKTLKLETSYVPGREEPAIKVYVFGPSSATAKGVLYEKWGRDE